MGKIILTAIILLVVLAGIVILMDNIKVQTAPSPSLSAMPSASVTPEETAGNIHVFSPQAGDEVGLPIVIKGEARTFEAAFSYRIKNSDGKVLVEDHSMTTGTADYPAYRPFEVTVNYPDPKTASGSVEVFEYSAKDGSEINKVIVPVKFKTVASSTAKVYFSKGSPTDCSEVIAVSRRVPKTETPIRTALDELLRGPYKADADAGYTTSINAGTTIKSVNLKSGTLTIDFEKNIEAGVGGSCRVTAIRAQITQTAKQFANVNTVVISVEGRTEDVLQP